MNVSSLHQEFNNFDLKGAGPKFYDSQSFRLNPQIQIPLPRDIQASISQVL